MGIFTFPNNQLLSVYQFHECVFLDFSRPAAYYLVSDCFLSLWSRCSDKGGNDKEDIYNWERD